MNLWTFVAGARRDYAPGIVAALCLLTCATPEMARGQPLWFEQNPPLLRADDLDGISFDNLVYAGDVESLDFDWRVGGDRNSETWTRVRTATIGGRLVSIFNPTWSADQLWEIYSSKGRNNGVMYFGELRTPTGATRGIQLRTAPLNLPSSAVARIDTTTQYASHVVNLVVPDFGNDGYFNLEDVARRFYEHFRDTYDSIAIVPAETTLMRAAAFHRNVRNPITGLGSLQVFDDSALYGSSGRLRAVEVYKDIGNMYLRIHEMAHQWVDFWDWSALTDGLEMRDRSHTPLLFPGSTFAGRLPGFLRIVDDGRGGFTMEWTPRDARRLHPTTLYRMGLLEPEAVPDMLVFENQRQRWGNGGTVAGGYRRVRLGDVIALHGVRNGPVDNTWRTATVVVSRDRLLSREEMTYWNFFAARHEAVSNVPGETTFNEATHGMARLHTDVTPRTAAKITNDPPLPAALPIDPHEFPGVVLDAPVPTLIAIGEPLTISGTVTSMEHDGRACVAFHPRFAGEGVSGCGSIVGDRFSISLEFSDANAGDHFLTVSLISLVSPVPLRTSRSTVGIVRVGDAVKVNRRPTVGETLQDRVLVQGGTLDVDVSEAFVDPDGDALTHAVSSSAPSVVMVSAAGGRVTLTAMSVGMAAIRVTATDPGGLSATQTFTVTVTANRPPEAVGVLPPLTIGVDDSAVTVDVASAFRDPDDDVLTYRASSSAPHVVTAQAAGARVTLAAVDAGTATVEVTATDPDGLSATQSFRVRVTAPFTDDPIQPGVTPVRAVHFTELRTRIDALRAGTGLGRFSWTDPVLRPGVTRVRRVHLLELRQALAEAYSAAGRAAPRWTDTSPAAGTTPIRALHVIELRAAVLALE